MPRRQASTLPVIDFESFQLSGGLDLITPPMELRPGVARDALNFEVAITGGYTRVAGYQRYDGRPAPNDAVAGAISMNMVTGLVVGNTITSPSAATAQVIAIDGLNVYYTKASGAFAIGDTISVGVTAIGTVLTTGSRAAGESAARYQKLAADVYRADIQPVPGSGPVRGVAYYNGSKYAWRDAVGGTTLGMWKSSSSGWVAVPLGTELAYNTGVGAIADGVTVTGGTSGATGLVSRNVLQSGTVGGGTAAGRLILTTVTGTWVTGEAIQIGGVTKATSRSAAVPITLQPGGVIETVTANFGGAQPTKLYGADGANRAFEFDPNGVYVPITTGMAVDRPVHVIVHKNQLMLTFGPSLQQSSLALPYQWSVVLGAGEFVVDDVITAIIIMPGDQTTGALGVYTAKNTYVLYGSSGSFQLTPFNTGLGASPYTVQNLEQTYQLAEPGVVSMTAVRAYGNFDADTLTLQVRPFMQTHRGLAVASGLNREKGQFRIFYSDGYALYITINNGKCKGSMPVYFPNPVTCWCEASNLSNGKAETSFFGSSSGYIYEMDTGSNFDGAPIDWTLRQAFNAIGNARVIKRFRKAAVEVAGGAYMAFSVGYTIGYADPTAHDAPEQGSYTTNLAQPYWDAMTWDNFYWDGRSLAPVEVEMNGSAENVAMQVFGSSDIVSPFTVNTITIHYSPRRALR